MANVFGKTLLGLSLAIFVTDASAQSDAFEEGIVAFRLGKPEEALAKFEEVIKSDPSNVEAFELYRRTDAAVWEMLMAQPGEINKIAKLLLERARVGRKEKSRDEASIDPLVETATTSDDYGERSKAMISLMADHGEFAVPAVIAKIGGSDDEKVQLYGILALQQIGKPATLALVEALKSDDETLRVNVVAALGLIKDGRAAAALAKVASADAKEGVRYSAGKVLQSMNVVAGSNPVQLYLNDARRMLTSSGVADAEFSEVVWSWQDGKLVAIDVPPALYTFELAKKSAHDALDLDPVNDDAKSLLARAYLAEVAAIKDAAARGDEGLAGLQDKVAGLRMMAAATGPDVLRRAVADSIASGTSATSVEAIELLAEVDDPASLGSSPLVAALDNADKRVAYAAALALAGTAGHGAVPAADRVVANLASAVTEESMRLVKVIDAAPATANVVEAAGKGGLAGTVEATGMKAMDSLFRFPNVDVVVINEILPDERPEAVIGLIKKDPRLAHVKVLVLAKDVDAAAEKFSGMIDGTIQAPLSAENLQKAVSEALPEMDESRKRADRVAVAASEALARLGANSVGLGAALDNLGKQLTRDDTVAVPAARALGQGGGVNNIASLLDAVTGDSASVDLKVAAAHAIGSIYSRAGQAPDEATFGKLLGLLTSGTDAKLTGAVSQALGRVRLTPSDKLKLIDALKGLVSLSGAAAASDEG